MRTVTIQLRMSDALPSDASARALVEDWLKAVLRDPQHSYIPGLVKEPIVGLCEHDPHQPAGYKLYLAGRLKDVTRLVDLIEQSAPLFHVTTKGLEEVG